VAKNIQAIRGMNDYLPGETAIWQRIEGTLKNVLGSYGYSEIRLPIVEQTPKMIPTASALPFSAKKRFTASTWSCSFS